MKTEQNILIAFLLNLFFAFFEFMGGIFTGSIAIISDSIHDIGDALSIGVSFFLEKKSKKGPDEKHTFGYIRYSVMGSLITTAILLVGSIIVICSALKRLIMPVDINYNGMIVFAVIGTIVNLFAVYFTKGGESLNQQSVNLHMLEDVFNWIIVLFGAIIMRFTNFGMLDSLLSILVALFVLISALKNLKSILDLFLEKTPDNISINEIKNELLKIKNIHDVYHIHVWSIDGYNNYATMHVTILKNDKDIKRKIREKLYDYNINHVTIEIDNKEETNNNLKCQTKTINKHHHLH